MLCHPGRKNIIARNETKMNIPAIWAKVDDSLPDFVTFVVVDSGNEGKDIHGLKCSPT